MYTFEVFSYWNLPELQLVFNAVAAIMGGSDFLGLVRSLIIVGLLTTSFAILSGNMQFPDFGRWLMMVLIFNAMLLVPKVNVVLTDRTGTQAPVTVANVPIGLAAFANGVSHIGDWLTTTFETTFSLPNDIQFRTNGTLWGHRVQQELIHVRFDNTIMSNNLLEFYRECIAPEFVTGFIVASDMAKANDIWTYLSGRVNPGRYVTIAAIPGEGSVTADTYGCDIAFTKLNTQMNFVNTSMINGLGKRLYPDKPTAAANAAVQSAIQTTTNYMFGMSVAATEAVKQTALANMMIDAQYMLPAQLGDTASASTNFAQAQAIRSTSDSYKMMAKLAESTMPKVKNIVEIVQYAIFPILFLLVVVAGHKGGTVIKTYVMSLVWVQLWPPLYAIMHLVMTMHARDLAAMTQGAALSMSNYSMVNNAFVSDQAIAGMIAATAIPAIAAALVKAGDIGAQSIAGMTTPARESERIASSMATGNMQMGNASFNNQSANNLSMGHYDTRPTMVSGGYSETGADNVRNYYGKEGGALTHVVDNSGAYQNIGAKVGMSQSVAGALTNSAESMQSATYANIHSAQTGMTANFQNAVDFNRSHSRGGSRTSGDDISTESQLMRSFNTATSMVHNYAQSHGLNQTQEAALMARATMAASGGINILGNGATVGAEASASGSQRSASSQVDTAAKALAENKDFRATVAEMRKASHKENFTGKNDAESRAAMGVKSSLDDMEANIDTWSATLSKSEAYKDVASRIQQSGLNFDTNNMNQFMGWMTTQHNKTAGRNFTVGDVEQMARTSPMELADFGRKFSNEVLVPELEKNIGKPENIVQATHDGNVSKVDGKADAKAAYSRGSGAILAAAKDAGVHPNTGPKNDVAGVVKKVQKGDHAGINSGTVQVIAEGAPVKGRALEVTDPTRQQNIAMVAQNTLATLFPTGTAKLLDNANMIDPFSGVAKPAADSFTGSTTQAVVETAIAVGGMALGGVGGRAVGGVAGKALGKSAGDVAETGAIKVAENFEGRLTTHATSTEAQAVAQGAATAERAVINPATSTAGWDALIAQNSGNVGRAATETSHATFRELTHQAATEAMTAEARLGRAGAAIRGATMAGAEREAGVGATYTVGGMLGGIVGGGVLGSVAGGLVADQIGNAHALGVSVGSAVSNGANAAADWVRRTDQDALNIIHDAASGNFVAGKK